MLNNGEFLTLSKWTPSCDGVTVKMDAHAFLFVTPSHDGVYADFKLLKK